MGNSSIRNIDRYNHTVILIEVLLVVVIAAWVLERMTAMVTIENNSSSNTCNCGTTAAARPRRQRRRRRRRRLLLLRLRLRLRLRRLLLRLRLRRRLLLLLLANILPAGILLVPTIFAKPCQVSIGTTLLHTLTVTFLVRELSKITFILQKCHNLIHKWNTFLNLWSLELCLDTKGN